MTIDTHPSNSPATAGHISSTRVHLPGSPAFDAGTRLWNGAVTRRPAAVVRPTSRSEVQSALRYAADIGIPVAVRGGGHDWAGRALATGGLVIDLSLMILDGLPMHPRCRRVIATSCLTHRCP